jgi:hypothetical protein
MLSKMIRWIDRSVRCYGAGTLEAVANASHILREET